MCAGEQPVGELARKIKLQEPTVSHHLSKLRECGLVSLHSVGTQRLYKANEAGLKQFKELAGRIGNLEESDRFAKSTDDWIDQLDWSSGDKAILHAHIKGGKLTHLPNGPKRTDVILRWIIMRFETGRLYTEAEVTETLKTVYKTDPVSLRRDLVDFGYLRRERGGGKYWVTAEEEKPG